MTTTAIRDLDPSTLLVDTNVRADLRLDKEFIASIRDQGVLVPIVAVETTEGIRVRMGHRRTAAAVEAGLATVPVVVVIDGDSGDIDRLLAQHAENHHRAGLTAGETAQAIHQLSLLGLSAAQIAKKTHTKRAMVDAALSVGASELASKATDRYDLTLDQAAVIAEFEGDTETVKALVLAAKEGKFDHVAQRARDARAEAEAKAPVIAELAELGVPVVDEPSWNDTAKRCHDLVDAEGEPIDVDAHASCPGRAAYLDEARVGVGADGREWALDRWGEIVDDDFDVAEFADDAASAAYEAALTIAQRWQPVEVCTDPASHGHMTRSQWREKNNKPTPVAELSEEDRETRRAERRLIIDNNKAWKSARTVRCEWIKAYLARKTLPATAGQFIAQSMTGGALTVDCIDGSHLAAQWLVGGDEEGDKWRWNAKLGQYAFTVDDKRALVVVLALTLGSYEANATDQAWRYDGENSATGVYLRFLESLGYELSDVEVYAASSQTA